MGGCPGRSWVGRRTVAVKVTDCPEVDGFGRRPGRRRGVGVLGRARVPEVLGWRFSQFGLVVPLRSGRWAAGKLAVAWLPRTWAEPEKVGNEKGRRRTLGGWSREAPVQGDVDALNRDGDVEQLFWTEKTDAAGHAG